MSAWITVVSVCLATTVSVGCNQVEGPVVAATNADDNLNDEPSVIADDVNSSSVDPSTSDPVNVGPTGDADPARGSRSPADPNTNGGVQVADPPRDPALVQERRVVTAENGVFDLTFDDLKFDIEVGEAFEREMLSEDVKAFDKKQIKIGGYIKPSYKTTGLKGFIFVRDDKECCFGPQAAIYDCVIVKLAKGTTTEFTVRPITVEGKFYLKEYEGPDGMTWAIFQMKNAKVVR